MAGSASVAAPGRTGHRARAGRLLLIGATLLLGLAGTPSAATAAETILVLGVARDGKADLKLSRQIQDRLGHGGETVAPAPRLTASERLCVAQDCLDMLAGREQASVVLTASVQKAGAGSHAMAALLYDAVRRKPFEASSECERCMPETLALRVGELFERLLKEHRGRVAGEPVAQTPPAGQRPRAESSEPSRPSSTQASAPAETASPARPAVSETPAQQQVLYPPRMQPIEPESEVPRGLVQESDRSRRPLLALSPRRKILAGVFGGVAGAALITAIALNATNGQPTSMDCAAAPGAPKYCVTDYRALYGTGYALAGLSLVGLGVTLFWPSGESQSGPRAKVAQRD